MPLYILGFLLVEVFEFGARAAMVEQQFVELAVKRLGVAVRWMDSDVGQFAPEGVADHLLR